MTKFSTVKALLRAKHDYLKFNGRCPRRFRLSQNYFNLLLNDVERVMNRKTHKTDDTLFGVEVVMDNRVKGGFRIE